MEPLAIVLALLLAAAAASAVWLALARARLASQAASAREAAARLEHDLSAAREEADRERRDGDARALHLQARLDSQASELARLAAASERLRAELAGAQEAHEEALAVAARRHQDAISSAAAQHDERLAAERRLMAERDRTREEFFAEHKRQVELAAAEQKKLVEQTAAEEKRSFEKRLSEMNAEASKVFEGLAAGALRTANQEFLKQAEEKFRAQHVAGAAELEKRREQVDLLVRPLAETMEATRRKLEQIEKDRAETFGRLSSELRQVAESGSQLRTETAKLASALRRPEMRGRYGEIQLRRVAEVAGMRRFCDFAPQESVRDSDGRLFRPDLVVSLPNDRRIAIDAKTNIDAYVAAIEENDADRAEKLLCKFADDVKAQVVALAKKQYWSNYSESPEFVVMFIPGDQFIDAALQRRPELLEYAAENRVILASPSTLIGLLRAVHVGWKEKQVADAAQELMEQGKELHRRAGRVWELLEKLGGTLGQSVRSYNELVGSVENRLTPALRKFEEKGAASEKPLPELPEITTTVRATSLPLFAPATPLAATEPGK
jgi:DNA recombination protein RmuC